MIAVCHICSCKNVKSLYNTKIINDKKICFYTDINNQFTKTLKNKLNEQPYNGNYNNCDYLALIYTNNNSIPINNIAGITQANVIEAKLTYQLFKYNKNKKDVVKEILQNSNLQTNEQYTGRKHYYFTEAKNVNNQIYHEIEDKETNDVRKKTTTKLLQYLKLISTGYTSAKMSYTTNILLTTSIPQTQQDIYNQLANNVAEKLVSDIIVDILNFQEK